MDRLEAMTILLSAVDKGSLSAASRHLNVPLATVSRRVAELEQHLGVRLVTRGSRNLTLTEAADDYIASCRRILEEIEQAERTAAGEYRKPQGELIISVPTVMGRSHALPVIAEFLCKYPDIRMRAQFTDRRVSLAEEHIDFALRIGELPDSSLKAARVGLIREVICASPNYLKIRGTPKIPADLKAHDCIGYEGGYGMQNNWEFRMKERTAVITVPSRLIVSTVDAAVTAATAHAGIARVFSYQIDDLLKARLMKLLEPYEPPPLPVNLVYLGQRPIPLKISSFLEFAVPRLRERLRYRDDS